MEEEEGTVIYYRGDGQNTKTALKNLLEKVTETLAENVEPATLK